MTVVIPAYVPSYANRQSYITPEEFTQDPNGVDVTQLVAGGDVWANEAALTAIIADGSAWADAICNQILGATTDVQVGRYYVGRDGFVHVPVDYSPIIAITDVQMGWSPDSIVDLGVPSGTWPRRKTVAIPVFAAQASVAPQFAGPWPSVGGHVYVNLTYVNGYANTTFAAAAEAGATSITVASPLGLVPSLNLGVYDGSASEPIAIGTGYTYGSTTVPLAAPLTYDHAAGVALSALPPEVRRATKLLTAALIKTRGDEAFQMAAINQEPQTTALGEPGLSRDVEIATALLARFSRAR